MAQASENEIHFIRREGGCSRHPCRPAQGLEGPAEEHDTESSTGSQDAAGEQSRDVRTGPCGIEDYADDLEL